MEAKKETVFSDPIYGYIKAENGFIKRLIDTKFFQRLRRIKQLSGVTMVFHTAEHSRFSHALGAYEIARRFLEIDDINSLLNEREKLLFLSSALLHDIGHGPYSHAFEKVFKTDHEKLGAYIISNDKEISNILNEIDDNFANDVSSIILREGRFLLIEQMISSQLDVDRLDYLLRDSYHTGVPYGRVDIDKILRTITVIDNNIVFKESALHTLESFFLNRYHMYWQVYYHPTGRSYEFILENIYKRIKNLIKGGYIFNENINPLIKTMENPYDLKAYLAIDDYYINGLINSFTNNNDQILKDLSCDFLNRHIWKNIEANDKDMIQKIKKTYEKNELTYYCGVNAVRQSIYQISLYDKDRELLIYDKENIVKLSEKSNIIKKLIEEPLKTDDRFFYRERDKWIKYL